MSDMKSQLVFAQFLDMIMSTPSPSRRSYMIMQQWYNIELHVAAKMFAPQDREWIAKIRSSHWSKMLFSSRLYFDCSIKDLFRMNSGSFAALTKIVCVHLVSQRSSPNVVLPPKRLAVFLYVCAQASTVRATADRFGIGAATVSEIVKEVAQVICRELQGLIAFPPFRLCASQFAEVCGVRQIVGCIDGCHIPIAKPNMDGAIYFNRKCWYRVVLQALVDWKGRYCDLDCKWPGRVGDSRVFRNSALAHTFPSIFD